MAMKTEGGLAHLAVLCNNHGMDLAEASMQRGPRWNPAREKTMIKLLADETPLSVLRHAVEAVEIVNEEGKLIGRFLRRIRLLSAGTTSRYNCLRSASIRSPNGGDLVSIGAN